jgi:aryl-alcohol dehydrogenase-like predicted oxidoreductase
MEYNNMAIVKRKFGWTNVDVSIIGQGTWMIENSRDSSSNLLAIKALQLGLDLGMLHIDTAEMYGNGKVEELVG